MFINHTYNIFQWIFSFQWGALVTLLISINMIYLCCRNRDDEENVHLLGHQSLEKSAQEKDVSYKEVNL